MFVKKTSFMKLVTKMRKCKHSWNLIWLKLVERRTHSRVYLSSMALEVSGKTNGTRRTI